MSKIAKIAKKEREPFAAYPAGSFPKALADLINCYSIENGSNTADYILAEYLMNCLDNFDLCVRRRDKHETKEG